MLIFLKLGGSLITDKIRPFTPRLKILDMLANQIAEAFHKNSGLQLIVGHGSGSFGHQPASRYKTRLGVSGPKAWQGFAEVWYQASALNRLVIDALRNYKLPAVTLAPFPSVTTNDGKIVSWDLAQLKASLTNGLLPVLHGDVVFDTTRGGTILSTEDIFSYLAHHLQPERILLAGLEKGVWKDFPARTHLLSEMTPRTIADQAPNLGRSSAEDVTGGMQTKVTEMLVLVEQIPDMEVQIFSGEEPGNIIRALKGEYPGTRLRY
jgi:isopentenyl phosphate kinase